MPEAAMHEYHRAILRQYDVGATRISPVILAITETSGEQESTYDNFCPGIPLSHPGHALTTLFFRQDIVTFRIHRA